MAKLIVLVLDNLEQCPAVLEAWEEAGATGVTILESTGLRRLQGVLRDDLPLLPSLSDLLASQELRHRTLFTVVENAATVERVVAATKAVVGDFSQHHSGLLFVLAVDQVYGLVKKT